MDSIRTEHTGMSLHTDIPPHKLNMHAHSCKSESSNGFGKILFYFDKRFFFEHVSGLGKLPEDWKFERVGSRPPLFMGSVQDTSPHFQDLIILPILTNQNIHVYEKNSLNFSISTEPGPKALSVGCSYSVY